MQTRRCRGKNSKTDANLKSNLAVEIQAADPGPTYIPRPPFIPLFSQNQANENYIDLTQLRAFSVAAD